MTDRADACTSSSRSAVSPRATKPCPRSVAELERSPFARVAAAAVAATATFDVTLPPVRRQLMSRLASRSAVGDPLGRGGDRRGDRGHEEDGEQARDGQVDAGGARITRQLRAASRRYATVGLRLSGSGPELGLATGHWSGSPAPASASGPDDDRVQGTASGDPCHVASGTVRAVAVSGSMSALLRRCRGPELRLLWHPHRLGERHPRRGRPAFFAPMA